MLVRAFTFQTAYFVGL